MMQLVVQQADAVHQQINSITALLEQFNARRSGLLGEASRRESDDTECQCENVCPPPSSSWSVYSSPTSCSNLPVEVLGLIFNYLDQGDLVRVSRAHKFLNVIANRVLYQSIVVSSELAQSSQCMTALVKHNHLALLVRSISIHWPLIHTPTKNLIDLLKRTLRALPSLTSLFIDVPNEFPQVSLDGCPFALQSFNTSFRFDHGLVRFLESQPSITDLSLRGFNSDPSQFSFSANTFNLNPTYTPPALSSSALPRLAKVNAIHAGPEIVSTVVKGRPVNTVVMPLYADCAIKCLEALTSTSRPIEKLSIMSFDPNAPNYILSEISKRFPELEALAVVLLLAECSEEALEAAAPSLARFDRLKYITFMSASPMMSSPRKESRIARTWHTYCPTLKTIILPMGNVLYLDNSTWSILTEFSA